MLDVFIMSVKAREDLAKNVADRIGVSYDRIIFDDRGFKGGGNCWYTCRKVWEMPVPAGVTHRLLLQDDILVVDGLIEKVERCTGTFPEAVWTFNNGVWLTDDMVVNPSPYIRLKGCKTSGEALAFPVEHIKPMIEWSDLVFGEDYIHDMSRYGYYCAYHGVKMFAVIPALVNHLQVDSMIPHHSRKDRVTKTWHGENPVFNDWNNRDYNTSPLIMSNVWMNKNNPRLPEVERIVRICKAKERGVL